MRRQTKCEEEGGEGKEGGQSGWATKQASPYARPGISQKLSYSMAINNMTVTTAEGVQSGLAKNFFWRKTFDEIWESKNQNMWTEVLLKTLHATASGSKI